MSITEKYEWHKDNYLISTDRKKLDVQAIHLYLTRSTWAKGIDLALVRASVENSLTFVMFISWRNIREKDWVDG